MLAYYAIQLYTYAHVKRMYVWGIAEKGMLGDKVFSVAAEWK